ncbi:hypothetical protein V2J09_007719 [Rumex salicifolius]
MATPLKMTLPATLLLLTIFSSATSAATVYNVITDFNARPDGVTNATQAFLMAWEAACESRTPAIIHVPKGRYLVYPVVFSGSGGRCGNPDITIRILGSLVAPTNYDVLGNAHTWISFKQVTGVTVSGGYLDARGQTSWACKSTSSNGVFDCPDGATSLGFAGSSKIVINGLTSLNSHLFHVVINQCKDVHIEGVKVIAPGDSPNTDGIHVQLSQDVTIFNSTMKTGDDCISIGPGTQNLLIERVACGPGHGISIGSLAKEKDEEGVRNVTVRKVVLSDTTNGLRIKSWARPSDGFVHDIRFENVVMRRVRGSSATQVAVQLECSHLYPCTGIKLQNVDLTYKGEIAQADCKNVKGQAIGLVSPNGSSEI